MSKGMKKFSINAKKKDETLASLILPDYDKTLL